MNIVEILLDVFQFGLPYAVLALGVFISYRVLDFADMTTEGTFVFGGALSIVLISLGWNPWLATLISIIGGLAGGFITGILHTKLKVPGLLAGIITMTGLFSINMIVFGLTKLGKGYSFADLYNSFCTIAYSGIGKDPTIFGLFQSWFDKRLYVVIFTLVIVVSIVATIIYLFFGTEVGMSMRATGMNPKMARAQGINTKFYMILGLAISNALIALSASLCAQRDLTISTTSGTGMLVFGLASIIIGESLFGKKTFKNWIISVVAGALVYYLIIAIAIALGLPSHLLKFLYAILIVIILASPIIKSKFLKFYNEPNRKANRESKKAEKLQLLASTEEGRKKLLRIEQRREKRILKEEALLQKLLDKRNERQRVKEERLNSEEYKTKLAIREAKLSAKEEKRLAFYQTEKGQQYLAKKTAKEKLKYDKEHVYFDGALGVKNLTKIFNPTGNPEDIKVALNGINLDIKEGEFVTIIGGNGSGKSTFFNTVSGVYTPDMGNIYIDERDVTKLPEYKKAKYIGRVAQDPYQGTAPNMSILENMSIALRRNKMKTLRWGFNKDNTDFFANTISTLDLGLENRMSTKIGLLSGGQRQAVTLLMATLEKPKVLFLDEHTAALDPKTANTVLELTDKIVRENNLTTVMVTHNMKDAIKYGDRLLMFNNGKVIYDVSGDEKKNLTVEQLLKKFEKDVEFSDKDILA